MLILSFSGKNSTKSIILGIILGTLFSHGLAIILGSNISSLGGYMFKHYFKLFTSISFILFGIFGFTIPIIKYRFNFFTKSYKLAPSEKDDQKKSFLSSILKTNINPIFLISICIIIGELGDKTLLSSISLARFIS